MKIFAILAFLFGVSTACAADFSSSITNISGNKYEIAITDASGKALTPADLKVAHTRKLHLLVVDPSLTDYQHLHPVFKNGKWSFEFTPKLQSSYRVWADINPKSTGKQSFVVADIGNLTTAAIDKTTNITTTVDDYKFDLEFDEAPSAGNAAMGQVTISKNGKEFKKLEPVMGAFAHIVGFSEDYSSIVHIHPMGAEPTKKSQRGGPVLTFHLNPKQAGFIKLFMQIQVDGKSIFAPFGIMVAK